jgi:hypothetical protein
VTFEEEEEEEEEEDNKSPFVEASSPANWQSGRHYAPCSGSQKRRCLSVITPESVSR